MDIAIIGNLLVEIFAAQAALGLALFAVVIAVIVRRLLADHYRTGSHPTARRPQ